jgi:predicted N-acetyltransferase YhbS
MVGYVSLSTAQVERAWLPKAHHRNRPDPLPAILLGQLAVDLRWQGQGVARSLMFYSLTTAVRLPEQVGCFCVLTHPLDDDVRALYAAFGFEDLPFDPGRGLAVRIADLARSGFGAAD